VTAQFRKTAEEEYEEQVRVLIRIVLVCTSGLFAFAVGLLIGTLLSS
jgi:phosphate/sulfate permease